MAELVQSETQEFKYIIVDCRFEYEFRGGHIAKAINRKTMEEIEREFMDSPNSEKLVIIFHCEFSSFRAPRL